MLLQFYLGGSTTCAQKSCLLLDRSTPALFLRTETVEANSNCENELEQPPLRVQAKLRDSFLVLWDCDSTADEETSCVGILNLKADATIERCQPTATLHHPFRIFQDETMYTFSAFSDEDCTIWIQKLKESSQNVDELQRKMTETRHASTLIEQLPSNRNPSTFNEKLASAVFLHPISRHFQIAKEGSCFGEWMYESRMSLLVPSALLKLFIAWNKSLKSDLQSLRQELDPRELRPVHLRHVSANLDHYQRALDCLDNYSGPCFKQSIRRDQLEFLFHPTNLHLQRFYVKVKRLHLRDFLTSGTCAAVALKFREGGCLQLRKRIKELTGGKEETSKSESTDLYSGPRDELLQVGRKLKQLTVKLDEDSSSQQSSRILLELGHQFKALVDSYSAVPKISVLEDNVRFAIEKGKSALKRLEKTSKKRPDVGDREEKWLRMWKNEVRNVAEALEQLRVVCLENQLCQLLFFHIPDPKNDSLRLRYALQLRRDVILSQAVSTVCTGLLANLWLFDERKIDNILMASNWHRSGPLVTIISHLSCYKDEKSMMEDMQEAWRQVGAICRFRLTELTEPTCLPSIEGTRSDLLISLPVPKILFPKVCEKFKEGAPFRVFPIFWNQGINTDALVAHSRGKDSLQQEINREALRDLHNYIQRETEEVSTVPNVKQAKYCYEQLKTLLSENRPIDEKILKWAAKATRALNGILLISCKSGKDRTGMAVTLEEGRFLKEVSTMSKELCREALRELRYKGVRRENCRKNIGIAQYAFTNHDAQSLPEKYKPPLGTYGMFQT